MNRLVVIGIVLAVALVGCSRTAGKAVVRDDPGRLRGTVTRIIGDGGSIVIREPVSDLEWEFPVEGNAARDVAIGQEVEVVLGSTGDSIVSVRHMR